jgi:hypothetical protein
MSRSGHQQEVCEAQACHCGQGVRTRGTKPHTAAVRQHVSCCWCVRVTAMTLAVCEAFQVVNGESIEGRSVLHRLSSQP